METLNNPKPIEEIAELLPTIQKNIEESTNEMGEYLNYLKVEKFEEKENEKEEDAIKRAESILEKLDEIVQKRKLVMEKRKDTIELIENVKLKIKSVVESCEKDEIQLAKANDELIGKIIDLEDRKRIRDITPFQLQIDDINYKSNKRIQDLKGELKNPEEYYIKKEEEARIKQEEEVKKRTNNIIDLGKMKQLEFWSGLKIGNIIFDSTVDNWNVNTSVFDQKVLNKRNLIFLIEDETGNLFGSYVYARIDKYDEWITDSKSFVFSLKSNGRLNGMFKFDITQNQYAFCLFHQSSNGLFLIGGGIDIYIYKENNKNNSSCNQTSFNYNGIKNALCGINKFTQKRITVIQLI